jgi:Putative Flp pilus-assembly TadE/G-like
MFFRASNPSRRPAAPRTRIGVARGRLRGRRRNGGRDEGGAVIVIVAVLLTAFMAAGALTIDLSAGRQSETKAQSAADASATAAADFIPVNPSASNPTGAALLALTTAATTMATQNGACATCVTVQYPYKGTDYSRVLVSVSGSSPATLGAPSGRSSIPVSASAVAASHTSQTVNQTPTSSLTTTVTSTVSNFVTQTTTQTVNPGTNQTPSAIFAHDTTCGDNPLTIAGTLSSPYSAANNINLLGSLYSNGNIGLYYPGSNGNFGQPISYGPGCAITGSTGGNYNGGRPVAASTTYPYPLDYSKDTIPCDFSQPTFSVTGTNATIAPGIYCATTSITINLGSGGNLTATGVTFVAPKITISAPNCVMSPASDAPDSLEVYDNSPSSSPALSINCSSNLSFGGGAIFSPNAPIDITSQNFDDAEFIEGYQVHIALPSGTINTTGDGPASGPNSQPTTTTNTINVSTSATVPVTNTVTNSYTLTNTTTVPDGSALAAP